MCPPPHPCSDPSWFNEAWLGRIQSGAEDNWRLKVGGGDVPKGGGTRRHGRTSGRPLGVGGGVSGWCWGRELGLRGAVRGC